MKANELMIGDWVKIIDDAPTMSGECHRVDWIRTGEFGLDNRKIVTYPYIEPIPLTEEILVKNGFIRKTKKEWEYIKDDILIVFGMYGWLSVTNLNFKLYGDIKYVHELQHALRVCGIEECIEL